MNPLAKELNQVIEKGNPHVLEMLSGMGKNLYFPRGILSQSAEAGAKAFKLNATIGIATEAGHTMHFPSVMDMICGIKPEESLTYAPSFGLLALRKAWQKAMPGKNPSLSNNIVSLPVVTCGITHAISVFSDLWIDPADVVLLPHMMWDNYDLTLVLRRGAKISEYSLFTETGGFDLQAFEDKVRQEARTHPKIIVLLNFPHNPTGYTVTEEEGDSIVDILKDVASKGTNVVAAVDDAYFGLFYEPDSIKESLFARLCGLHPRLLAIKLDGATKEYFVWGLRVGFITYGIPCTGDPRPVYEALEKKTAGNIRATISNASHLSQSMVLKSMQDTRSLAEQEEKFEVLKRRANRVREVLADPKYQDAWDVYPFNSGYFMCIRLKALDAETVRLHLLETYGVGLISMGKTDLRIAFSCLEEKEIPELFDRLLQAVDDVRAGGV
ncbi:MAG: aminotransferase class I/II-fold pyridoxal phosphate-dependent enzyme [Desulfobacterales bacterium]|nr:aminotransferase class I/II-fold pyridoxal phosphate-dependent enzyme [Desulfobacterales bacterium]